MDTILRNQGGSKSDLGRIPRDGPPKRLGRKRTIFAENLMDMEKQLQQRSGNTCELCGSEADLGIYEIPDSPSNGVDAAIYICNVCKEQIENPEKVDPNH